MNFPSVRGGQGLSKGRQGLGERGEGVAGGLEQGSWGLGRVSKGLEGWGLEMAEGLGSGGAGPSGDGTDVRSDVCSLVCSFARSDGWMDRQKFPPLFYRILSPSGPLPKRMIRSEESEYCKNSFDTPEKKEKNDVER